MSLDIIAMVVSAVTQIATLIMMGYADICHEQMTNPKSRPPPLKNIKPHVWTRLLLERLQWLNKTAWWNLYAQAGMLAGAAYRLSNQDWLPFFVFAFMAASGLAINQVASAKHRELLPKTQPPKETP